MVAWAERVSLLHRGGKERPVRSLSLGLNSQKYAQSVKPHERITEQVVSLAAKSNRD